MADDQAPERESDPEVEVEIEIEIEADEESFLDDDGTTSDDTRHYQQDPNGLADSDLDADEQEQADVLDLDQTELEELGLTLDDPHQPDDDQV